VTSRWAALAVVFLTRLSMGFQFQSIASVGPFLVEEFRLTYAQLGWLLGLFLLPGSAIALPGSALGRRFGDRRVAVAGLALMTVGGAITATSGGLATACAGRVVSGIGGVLLNVVLAKMVADWFAGRELSTAMAIMLTAWPAGIALAVASLGAVAALVSWRVTVHLTAAVAALAGVLMVALYRDPPAVPAAAGGAPGPARRLPRRVVALAAAVGLAWGLFNAGFIVFLGFAPAVLVARGATIAQAGLLVSVAVWITLGSVPLGGWLADRARRRDALIVAGSLGAAAGIVALVRLPGPLLWAVLTGLVAGLTPGAMMTLLPQSVAAEHLALGFGVYYTVFYLGMAVAQPAAGLVRDLSGRPDTPVDFAAALMAATALALAGFRLVQRRATPPSRG
jgi:MFS family permease